MSRANATRTVRSDASVVVGARDRVGGGGPTCRAERHDSPWKSRIDSATPRIPFFRDWFVYGTCHSSKCSDRMSIRPAHAFRDEADARRVGGENHALSNRRTDIVPRAVAPLSLARDIRCLPPAPFSRPRRSRRRVSRRGDRARDPRVARPPPRRARVRGRWTMRFAAARPPRRAPRPSARCSRTRRTA